MSFYSILFETTEDRMAGEPEAPDFFDDLNCDRILAAITAGRDEYDLKPFFYASLRRVGAITYRHEVMQDLEDESLRARISIFAREMRETRDQLRRSRELHYKEQRWAWFLDAVGTYCWSVSSLADDLHRANLRARGFLGFRDYLTIYAGSSQLNSLASEARSLKTWLAKVDYCVHIKGNGFTVRNYQGEADYSAEVEAAFEKFNQGTARDYLATFTDREEMNHIEAKIVEFVARLNPDLFAALDNFCRRHSNFIDRTIANFDREIQFYLAYLEYIDALRSAGLCFCYPRISCETKELYDRDGFDIALAGKLIDAGSTVVCNDFELRGDERILVISGPNQGGKTTFARAFGQLHYLAGLGCPVPGRDAQLFLFDQLFTLFEKEEKVEDLRGKLEDDLLRIRAILRCATSQSIVILNEVFTSTTVLDETFLSCKVMQEIANRGLLCVWVTFVDQLAAFGPQTVSMVSTVVPENPALRTFKIVRQPADGLAYAMAIARKHGLTYDSIRERIKS